MLELCDGSIVNYGQYKTKLNVSSMHICNEYLQVMEKDSVTYLNTYVLPDLLQTPNDLENYLHSINLGSIDEICEELWDNEQQRS